MSAVCPKCGVAVVPGYVKCPKCQAALPSAKRTAAPGGTVAAGAGRTPVMPFVLGGAVALGIVLFFALRKDSASEAAPPPESDPQADPAQAQQPAQPQAADPTAMPADPPSQPDKPDPTAAVNALSRALTKQRLWGKVEVVGDRVDVRSGACSDPGMAPVLDANTAPLRDAGLTKLRCMEQSGAVVFEREF